MTTWTEGLDRLMIETPGATATAARQVPRAPEPPRTGQRASLIAAALVTALLGVSGAAWAAAPAVAAAVLSGRFADAAGPLPGAEVVARNTADGRELSTVTAVDGTFRFDLPAGVYELEARLDGIRYPAETGIRLAPGDRLQVAIEGEPFDLGETSAVVEQPAAVVDFPVPHPDADRERLSRALVSDGVGRRMMELLAQELDGGQGDLTRLLVEAQRDIRDLYRRQELELVAAGTGGPAGAAREDREDRLATQVAAVEKELRQRFRQALNGRL